MDKPGENEYIVVFEYTKEAGGYEGVITWSPYGSKEKFDKLYTPERQKMERVVAEGVSMERAIELVKQTPIECYVRAATQEAFENAEKIVNLVIICPFCKKDKKIKVNMNDPESAIIINHGKVKCAYGQTYPIEGNIDYKQSEF